MKQEPGVEVKVVDGNRGELTVSVDGRVLAKKDGDSLPAIDEVVAAVLKAAPVGTGA